LPPQEAKGDVAGAARHIEEFLARTRIRHIDQGILPEPVDAARHQVVHQVVARGHAFEHPAHHAGLFGRRDVLEAEGRLCRRG
jgi:hypothetical protein